MSRKKIYTLLQVLFAVVILVALFRIHSYYKENREQVAVQEQVAELMKEAVKKEEVKELTPEEKGKSAVEELRKEIPDAVGYIDFPETKMQHVVVQGEDDEFYLNHDAYKRPTELGAVFMDSRNDGNGKDSNTVLYGHNVRRGTFFGGLKQFKNREFLDSHPYFFFTSRAGTETYRIFAVLHANEYADYRRMINNETQFKEWMEYLKTLDPFYFEEQDYTKTLTLSTCQSPGTRMVVIGKKVE